METICKLAAQIEERLLMRNEIIERFFLARGATFGGSLP